MKQLLLCCLLSSMLAACVANKPAVDPAVLAAQEKAAAEKAALEKKIDANMAIDANFIPFDKLSPKLDEVGKGQLLRLLPKLKASKTIIVRGHCYRGDIGNAKAASQARAIEVKTFLTDSGVPESRVTVRYDTDRKTHGVQLIFK
ncbi:OmpA family protein [uncultured Aquitalea sp.]|uniref:OmpA family protein n=1 Tax=uncultured Aquitalea sp. TaxID=540272 RepID=UPI0025F911B9|nr:OmpA family protein [uncultured Aquitalea sp.]